MLYTAPRVCDFPLHNIVVSRHPLARLVGCSASTLSTTYHDCGQNKYTRLSYPLLRDPESQKQNKKTISIPLLRELVFFVLGVLIVIIQQQLHVRRTGVFLSLRCFVQPLQGKDICLDKMNWKISTF